MNELEAISLASEVIRLHPIAEKLNLAGATATFIDGAKAIAEGRAESPNMNFDFRFDDRWVVEFPLWQEDKYQRTTIGVRVDTVTKKAEIIEECV